MSEQMGRTKDDLIHREWPRALWCSYRLRHRERAAWFAWLRDLRARVWVAHGRMCEHGGSKAAERVADAAHAATWYARDGDF